jgi:DNA invertase Pin-like site-specific DNA recombinase
MTTFLYARVSTSEQTLDHQLTQARAAGYAIDDDHVIADHGVSGVSTKLAERENGKLLFKLLRKGDVLVVRWLDRLGRNYQDVKDAVETFMKRGVIVRTIINGFVFDGSLKDPMQMAIRDALLGFMAAMGQAQAEATKDAQRAGIAHAKANDDRAYRGRKPTFTRAQFDQIVAMADQSHATIAKATGLPRLTVFRIRKDPATAEAALVTWGM